MIQPNIVRISLGCSSAASFAGANGASLFCSLLPLSSIGLNTVNVDHGPAFNSLIA